MRNSIAGRIVCALLILCAAFGKQAEAQTGSIALTITPPLFRIAMAPGEFWASSISVVNTNEADIEVYATVMDLEPLGEEGHSRFVPVRDVENEEMKTALSQWVTVAQDPFLVPKEKSVKIPFSIRVPDGASPGGHYAAILIGTRPPAPGERGGAAVGVSSFISSLLFVRIAGDVVEDGSIREFATERTVYDAPDVRFTLRFENKGNVHVQPQGTITIYNMWGKERGKIDLRERSEFGNVLPSSTRKFGFVWKGERNFFDIGKYTAVAALSYGSEGKKTASETVSFWIIPVKQTGGVVGGFVVTFLVFAWTLRKYVRRALALEMRRRGISARAVAPRGSHPALTIASLARPLREGIVDLREDQNKRTAERVPGRRFGRRLGAYTFVFLIVIPLLIGGGVWVVSYFREVLTKDRGYEIDIERMQVPDVIESISDEEQ